MMHGNYHFAEVKPYSRALDMGTALSQALEEAVEDLLLIAILDAYATVDDLNLDIVPQQFLLVVIMTL